MAHVRRWLRDALFMLFVLVVVFFGNIYLQEIFATQTLIPMIFVLGVFMISWKTQGYFWGITASLISVLMVNYAFTYPYFAFDMIRPECVSSALIMLIVSGMTGALTTKIKQQEKIRAETEMERMRGNLLRAISHDLRTPLTSIYGSCSAIIDNYDSLPRHKQLKLLQEMSEDSQWLIRMVENLLSVTRIDGGKVKVVKTTIVLDELIDFVLQKFHKHHPEYDVNVVLPEEFVSIPMDPMLIEQVLINILENAVFHAEGMTQLELHVHTQENRAVFEVLDDGCGISEEKMDRLFRADIYSGETDADSNRNGMGIGLSVCSTIIKAHGGEIFASNRPGGGAKFSFWLETDDDNNAANEPESPMETQV